MSDAARGLTTVEATSRLATHGPNELARGPVVSPWRIFLRQWKGALIWILLGASAVSAAVGEWLDAGAIGAILLVNALIGFFQEFRSERAVQALRSMTAPKARVLRDNESIMLAAREIVPGDLLLLEAGDLVAADARLIEAHDLQTSEAALTGESTPIDKGAAAASGAPLAERTDLVFLGTAVARGTATAEVFATGMQTELGRIATLIATADDTATPLQRRLERVARTLLWLCLGVVVLVAGLGLLRGSGWLDVLVSSISLAVAAVPEGLAAIVTVALAIGVQRMAARNVLVRKLSAVETLGSTTVICTDKTGTLTTGVMVVREVWGPDAHTVLFAAAANCEADLAADGTGIGDPTEVALLMAAAERGIRRADIERDVPRTATHPFDSDRKRMSIRRADGKLYVKGAVESLVPLCVAGAEGALDAASQLAGRGLRVLAIAAGAGEAERELTLLGLVGMADPPRPEATAAVAQARAAGITTVMITGDHPGTAAAIAREMGIVGPGEDVTERVHARATPEDKITVVRAWKERGAVVAMTGDGVNDAPALKEAHIGIAMGKSGTEVAREASDMVLTDDNFASIVAAVQEGRGIYQNIQKTLTYLLAGNFGELLLMLVAALLGLPLPLLPLQILWINLATDGLPAIALVMDPVDPDVLRMPPRRFDEPLLGRSQWTSILFTGALQTAVTLGTYVWALRARNIQEARNLAFSVLVFIELFRAFAARSPTKLFWQTQPLNNWRLLVVVLGSAAIQIAIHHVPFTQRLFDIGDISLGDCLLGVGLGLIPVSLLEITKLARQLTGKPDRTALPLQ